MKTYKQFTEGMLPNPSERRKQVINPPIQQEQDKEDKFKNQCDKKFKSYDKDIKGLKKDLKDYQKKEM
jgi:hypothetical protein